MGARDKWKYKWFNKTIFS